MREEVVRLIGLTEAKADALEEAGPDNLDAARRLYAEMVDRRENPTAFKREGEEVIGAINRALANALYDEVKRWRESHQQSKKPPGGS